MIAPPSAGPAMAEIWKALLFHVVALLNTSAGTICGSRADRAGHPIAFAVAPKKRHKYISGSDPCVYDRNARPSDASADPAMLNMMIRRRSNRSASMPEGIARDRKSTRLNSSHLVISYAVFCLKKKK